VIKLLLYAILILLVARAFWRVVDGILDGARGPGGPDRRATPVKLVRDPVCGTFVAPGTALSLSAGGTTYYFCSDECRRKYRAA
jgi:YHS domain-containing protein